MCTLMFNPCINNTQQAKRPTKRFDMFDGNYLRIDRNFCSVHEEIISIKDVYNLIEVISNEPNK